MQMKRVCILGGTGFVGHYLSVKLASQGIVCRIISRHPERHRDLLVLPSVELVQGNSLDSKTLSAIFQDCDAVINLVGILNESGKNDTFERIHVAFVDEVMDACRSTGIARILHMSALNADAGSGASQYLRTKGEGENHINTGAGAHAAITRFRPSVIFGPGDGFFNRFAHLLRIAPGVFPLACPNAKFAPVFVNDVAQAFTQSLTDKETFGKCYDLCGPRIFTLQHLVQYTAKMLGLHTLVIGLGDKASRMQAKLLGLVPGKPFSYDNYLSLQVDSVCKENGFDALGLKPTDMETIVPTYVGHETQRQQYQTLRTEYWGERGGSNN